MLDAGMALWAERTRLCAELAEGGSSECRIGAVGNDVNEWLTADAVGWSHLLSVRPTATPAQLRMSLPGNRALVERGLQMVSVFDYERLDDECRRMLVEEPVGDYLFAVADIQMKVIDHERVLLEGPTVDGRFSVLEVRSARVLEQAMRYWNTVLVSAFECGRERAELGWLSERQQRVVGLMQTGMTDEAIARQLHVSVRTVRSEVAHVLETLQVRSRFSAGFRLGRGEVLPD
ncbi:helix-turn-helix transcriptional regulator [Arthrobacter sp. NEB 688]|uniref:helix-turn-helix transcriptional regulator n=1 Tax=Arthrobacter sp. NEB 688 TaxID=904039 RepID=UPI001566630E|nr:helix-turn-helix transcriptional regulator [Arthrobacter sp. NEB 688]QKE82547.1 helix-turn-helix transcriptional regulator [Arthrobacter sp. NEB 688]